MKKILALICALVMALCLTGCTKSIQEAKVGDVVEFGRYREEVADKKFKQNVEPIEWIVIDIDEKAGYKLALCRTTIVPFDIFGLVTDTNQKLKSYAGVELFLRARGWKIFNDEEKKKIKPLKGNERTTLDFMEQSGLLPATTVNGLFLLSAKEVNKYLSQEQKICKLPNNTQNYIESFSKDSDFYIVSKDKGLKTGTVGWWLRPDKDDFEENESFPIVTWEGKVGELRLVNPFHSDYSKLSDLNELFRRVMDRYAVVIRPAIWIKYK